MQEVPVNDIVSVVIVEDEAVNLLFLQKVLQQYHYCIKASFSGSDEVIQFLEHDSADIVLMDIMISGKMDGIETAELIKTRFDIPVIFITAHTDELRSKGTYGSPFATSSNRFQSLKCILLSGCCLAKTSWRLLKDGSAKLRNFIFILTHEFRHYCCRRRGAIMFGSCCGKKCT